MNDVKEDVNPTDDWTEFDAGASGGAFEGALAARLAPATDEPAHVRKRASRARTIDVQSLLAGETLSGRGSESTASEELEPEAPMSREQRRSRRKRPIRACTISVKRMTKRELEAGRLLYPEAVHWKPQTRGDCADAPRPCPFVSCKHHLYVDVNSRTGAIKLNFPDIELWDMAESCALDVADRGHTTLEDVGAIMNLTRERIRQVEVKALARLKELSEMESIRELIDEGPVGRRRLPVLSSDEVADVRRKERKSAGAEGLDADDDDFDEECDDELALEASEPEPPSHLVFLRAAEE